MKWKLTTLAFTSYLVNDSLSRIMALSPFKKLEAWQHGPHDRFLFRIRASLKMSMLTCYSANRDVTSYTLYVCNVTSTGRMETVQVLWNVCDELSNVRPST
jgi:hypothetical protein